MATYFLLNNVRLVTTQRWAGEKIDDAQEDVTKLTGAGGSIWPSSDAVVAAAAVIATQVRARSGSMEECQAIMLASTAQVAKSNDTDMNSRIAANTTDIATIKGGGIAGTAPVHCVDLATAVALPAGTAASPLFTVTATGTLTVDGVVTTLNQRILVKDQVATQDNGIYKVTTAGAMGVQAVLTRDTDGAAIADYQPGMLVATGPAGTANPSLEFMQTSTKPVTLGTTAITFALAAGIVTATDGLLLTGSVLTSLNAATYGTALGDDAAAILLSAGAQRVLPAATLTANRSKALSMTGATAKKQITILRLDQSANTLTITDAGPGTPTLCVFPAGWMGSATFQSDGTNWFLKSIGSLAQAASATLPGTLTAAHFNDLTQKNPAYKARGVVLTNMAALGAFVVTQNGVTYVAGDVVLLANQTTAAECGLYLVGTVAGTAPLTRIAALPTGATYVNGCTVEVAEGTLYPGSTWKAMATGANVVGTNDPLFYPRVCAGVILLASGTYTLGSTEGFFLWSTARGIQCTMDTPGGVLTLTNGYGSNLAGRSQGKSGVAAAIIISRITAGTIDAANNSTVAYHSTNW